MNDRPLTKEDLQDLVRKGQEASAADLVEKTTGVEPALAKKVVASIAARRSGEQQINPDAPPLTKQRLHDLIHNGDMTAATSLIYRTLGVGRSLAKEIVDDIGDSMTIEKQLKTALSKGKRRRKPDPRHADWIIGRNVHGEGEYIIHTKEPRFIAQILAVEQYDEIDLPEDILGFHLPKLDDDGMINLDAELEEATVVVDRLVFIDDGDIDAEHWYRTVGEASIKFGLRYAREAQREGERQGSLETILHKVDDILKDAQLNKKQQESLETIRVEARRLLGTHGGC